MLTNRLNMGLLLQSQVEKIYKVETHWLFGKKKIQAQLSV